MRVGLIFYRIKMLWNITNCVDISYTGFRKVIAFSEKWKGLSKSWHNTTEHMNCYYLISDVARTTTTLCAFSIGNSNFEVIKTTAHSSLCLKRPVHLHYVEIMLSVKFEQRPCGAFYVYKRIWRTMRFPL